MKKAQRYTFLCFLSFSAVLAVTLAMSGCSALGIGGRAAIRLSSSSALPAVEGLAKFKATKNNNTRITLTVKHLPQPEKLTPPANQYIVWTRAAKDESAQNIGALVVDKNLNGKLETETPLHTFELFITAEVSGQIQQPFGEPLLWISYNR
jgi:hypothetical protein